MPVQQTSASVPGPRGLPTRTARVGSRILIVRIAALGDVVMASAMLARIRREQPDAHVTWLCGTRASGIVRLFDGVDEVLTVDEQRLLRGGRLQRVRQVLATWARLAPRRFDLVLLGHPDPRYRLLVAPLRRARIHALTRREHGRMLPIAGRFAGDEYARLVDGPGHHRGPIVGHWQVADVRARLDPRSLLPDRSPAGERWVALVPGGARNVLRENALRRWPVEAYADVARRLAAQGHRVVLVGDAADAWVRPHFADVPVEDRLGAHTLEETLAVLRDADLVISHDTGPMHLARAVRAPLIALFGPTSPRDLLLPDDRTVVLWGGADLACRPCYDGRDFADCASNVCIREITPDRVLAEAGRFLDPPAVEQADPVV